MKRFTALGKIHVPRNRFPNKPKKKKQEKVILPGCFCANGHSLFDGNIRFDELEGIKLKAITNKEKAGNLILHPAYGNYSKISVGFDMHQGDLLDLRCPECDVQLPVFSECSVCGSQMLTLFTTNELSYAHCVGICQKVGCHNSKMVESRRLLSTMMKNI